MAAETDIHAALMARVEELTLTPAVPVAYPGVPFDPPAGEYIRATHLPNEPVRTRISGTGVLDRFGFLQLDLFTPLSNGQHEITMISRASEIAAHFPHDLVLREEEQGVRVISSYVGRGRVDPERAYWMTPVVIQYRAQS